MLTTTELYNNGINLKSYAVLFVYHDSGCIDDVIEKIANDNIVDSCRGMSDWLEFHSEEIPEEISTKISEVGWDNCWIDLREDITRLQVEMNKDNIYPELYDALEKYVLQYLSEDLGIEEISEENWEEIQNFLFDITPDNKFEEITDFLDEMFSDEDEE